MKAADTKSEMDGAKNTERIGVISINFGRNTGVKMMSGMRKSICLVAVRTAALSACPVA